MVVVRTQCLAHLSLSLSLLAAFGAVPGKQWLNQFKTSRFGLGTAEGRGLKHYDKFSAIKGSHLHAILDSLLVILQLSLLLFGISLAINIFMDQAVLGILMATMTSLGIVFYGWIFVTGVLNPKSPFQFGLTILTEASSMVSTFRVQSQRGNQRREVSEASRFGLSFRI